MKKLFGEWVWLGYVAVFWLLVVPPMYFVMKASDTFAFCTQKGDNCGCGFPMREGFPIECPKPVLKETHETKK